MKSVKKFLKRSEISFVTKGQLKDDGEYAVYKRPYNKQTTATQPGVVSAVRLHRHPRCARTLSTPSLQALTGKRVVASLLGHSRLVALCSLAFSQEGQ